MDFDKIDILINSDGMFTVEENLEDVKTYIDVNHKHYKYSEIRTSSGTITVFHHYLDDPIEYETPVSQIKSFRPYVKYARVKSDGRFTVQKSDIDKITDNTVLFIYEQYKGFIVSGSPVNGLINASKKIREKNGTGSVRLYIGLPNIKNVRIIVSPKDIKIDY